MVYQFVILNGERRGERITMTREPMIIGRDETCAIRFNDPEIAPAHAEISQKPEGLFIRDLGSMNRLTVNNRAVREVHPQHGDVIEVGQTRFMVQFRDQAKVQNEEEDDSPLSYTRWIMRGGIIFIIFGLLYAMMQCRPTIPTQSPRSSKPTPSRTNATVRTQTQIPQPAFVPVRPMPATAAEPVALKSPPTSPPVLDEKSAINAEPAAVEPALTEPVVTVPSKDNPIIEIPTADPSLAELNDTNTAANTIALAQRELQEAESALLESKVQEMMEEAHGLASNKCPAAAEQLLAEIETIKPDFLEASAARAAMLEEQGKLDPALALWTQLLHRATNTPLAKQAENKIGVLSRARNELVFPFVGRIKIAEVDLKKIPINEFARDMRQLNLRLVATELQKEIDPDSVRVDIRFYDRDSQTGRIMPTDARISVLPLKIQGPWLANEKKTLEVSYMAPVLATTNTPVVLYYGFIIRVLYHGALQDVRIQPDDLPEKLKQRPPVTIPETNPPPAQSLATES